MNWAVLIAILSLMCAAQAQALSDPMRPPQAPAAPAGTPAAGSAESAPASQLSAILVSGGRKLAVIDGAAVPLGGLVGDAKVVRITETEVTLRRGKELRTLRLHPAVEKIPVREKTAAKPHAARKPADTGKAPQ